MAFPAPSSRTPGSTPTMPKRSWRPRRRFRWSADPVEAGHVVAPRCHVLRSAGHHARREMAARLRVAGEISPVLGSARAVLAPWRSGRGREAVPAHPDRPEPYRLSLGSQRRGSRGVAARHGGGGASTQRSREGLRVRPEGQRLGNTSPTVGSSSRRSRSSASTAASLPATFRWLACGSTTTPSSVRSTACWPGIHRRTVTVFWKNAASFYRLSLGEPAE